jgi:CelD/BcsL family acetyltransferase involved in cellulose biosynthesis
MMHIDEINDLAGLESLRLTWQTLLRQTANPTYFQSLDWLLTYLQHYGQNQRLRVLVVESKGQTIGILPLVVRSQKTSVGNLRVLTYPLDDWGSFYAPLGGNPTATLVAGLRHIQNTHRDWDLLDLRWVDRDGLDRGRSPNALRLVGFAAHEQRRAVSAQIELPSTCDEYWNSRDRKFRANVRRSERLLHQAGEVRFVRYRPQGVMHDDADPRFDLYDTCVQIAAASWQANQGAVSTLTSSAIRAGPGPPTWLCCISTIGQQRSRTAITTGGRFSACGWDSIRQCRPPAPARC